MEISNNGVGKLGLLTISHGEDELTWNASNYDAAELSEPESLFRDINGYWASLPLGRQEKIFDTYAEINDVLATVVDTTRLIEQLKPLVQKLYVQHPFGEISYWIRMRANIIYPSTLLEDYSPDHPKETTYLRRHYQDLAALALWLRPMVPIWGEFIRNIRQAAGRSRERLAVRLLALTEVLNAEPSVVLRNHVEQLKNKSLEKRPIPLSALISAVGSEDVGEWLFCMVLVRRVALGELSQRDYNINIVSNVHKQVTQQLDHIDRHFGGRICEKMKENGRDDDNASHAESYKARPDLDVGAIATIEEYMSRIEPMVAEVDPTLPKDKLDICIKAARAARKDGLFEGSEHQTYFTKYILPKVISPRALDYPDVDQLFEGMVVAQAMLWHWGFPQLASLMFVKRAQLRFGTATKRTRITKENIQLLHEAFPHFIPSGSQRNGGQQAEDRTRNDNLAVKNIENLAEMITKSLWIPACPQEILDEAVLDGPVTSRMILDEGELVVPSDILNILARFALKVAKHNS